MFVLRRKSDKKFRTKATWGADRKWSDSIKKARIFNRIEGAKQASGYVKGVYLKPLPSYSGWQNPDYVKAYNEYKASYINYTDETRPVYIEKVFVIPESLVEQ
jgi:hypothetical protein